MIVSKKDGILRQRLHRFFDAPPPFIPVPSKTRTERAAIKVVETFGDLTPRRPENLELNGVLRRVRAAWRDRRLASLSRRDARLAPYVFFYPESVPDTWLGLDPIFLHAYDVQAPGSDTPRATIALLYEFLRHCEPEFATYDRIRVMLYRRFFQDEPAVRLNRWRERCRKYRLLEDDNHVSLVRCWRQAGAPLVEDFLHDAGLAPSLERSTLVRRAARVALVECKSGLHSGRMGADEIGKAISWLVTARQLRFETLRVEIADSMLGPFVASKPDEELGAVLREFFLNHFGDPRTAGIRGWVGVPEDQRHALLRILVERTLQDFFRLLDRTADKQWAYRKAFWSAYEQRDVILDAWVALGPRALAYAGSELRESSGRVTGVGGQGNQSVLLMKIEGVTIAEWSHNGKCRFWGPAHPMAPVLYRNSYTAAQLRGAGEPDAEVAHHGSETGKWQERIAKWISSATSVRLVRSQYMPGGW